jgi:hypothetical protein
VNRHERRAAAARNRGKPGYLHRLVAAMRNGAMRPTPGVHIASIDTTLRAASTVGAGCDCVPDISVSGPDGVTTIDERGVGTKRARQ